PVTSTTVCASSHHDGTRLTTSDPPAILPKDCHTVIHTHLNPERSSRSPPKRGDLLEEAQANIDDAVKSRGYVLEYHKILAASDFPILEAANHVVNAAYLEQRTLSRASKELLFVLSLTVLRAPKPQLRAHIRVALDLGVSPKEL